MDSRSRDLRTEIARRGIGIRNQGGRGTCSVFAMTFLLEYAYTEMLGGGYADLSEEYLNHVANVAVGKTDDGDFFSSVAAGYENFGIIAEGGMVYNPNRVYDFNAVTITPQMYAEGRPCCRTAFVSRGISSCRWASRERHRSSSTRSSPISPGEFPWRWAGPIPWRP